MSYEEVDNNEGGEQSSFSDEEVFRKAPPQNALDLTSQLIEPDFSKSEISPELRKILTIDKSYKIFKNEEGEVVKIEAETELLWSRLNAIFTKDPRLSNLTAYQERYVSYFMDLGSSFMELEGQQESAIKCVSKFASVSEPAQSRGGWLRKIQNTLISENTRKELAPKKSFMSGKPGE